jgi:histone deacetylase HOS3
MQNHSRSSPSAGHNREQSPSLSPSLDRLSIITPDSPVDGRRASRVVSSPMASKFPSTAPGAPEQPHVLPRASSSMSQAGTPPRRKLSMSSLRGMTSQTSPASSPRRGDRPSSIIGSYSSSVLVEEPPPLTAASVAASYFAHELLLHESEATTAHVAVILHDACYGHRFSRPKTSKGSLSMIVERPERILAAVLGLCTAYVRLGSRHSGGQHAPHPDCKPLSAIPFKIKKTSRSVPLTSSFVSAVHGTEWMKELEAMCNVAGEKLASHMKELTRPETPGTSTSKDPFHEGDLYLCSESLNALQGAIGGVCEAVDTIFSSIPTSPRRAFVAIRPPGHHCSADFPSGFCWINNVHIGIEYAAQTYGLTHAVILDIDLHHGDGSQDVTWERNAKSAKMPKNAPYTKKTAIGYYSMHDINSYPCEDGDKDKVTNASLCIDNIHNQSIWNVHLEAWSTMDEFWALYETKYIILLQKARTFLQRHTKLIKDSHKQAPPKAAIFISAGFDASQWEGAGMQRHAVNVPTEFYARFAKDVVELAHEEGTGAGGRVISVLEGGYSDRALCSGVLSHVSGLCQDPESVPSKPQHADDDIASAMQSMKISSNATPQYNSDWWDVKNLKALETHVTPPPPPPIMRSQRTAMPTYATPTQSFSGKVVDQAKFQRSISGTMRPMSPRLAGPRDPPQVDWVVAVHELSKLIIPSDRQTRSHAPEDLAPVRVKKDRLSAPVAMPAEPVAGGRQLRIRKPKNSGLVSLPTEADGVLKPPPVDLTRRQTISDLPTSSAPLDSIQLPKRTTRRASNMFNLEPEANDEIPPVPTLPISAKTSPRKPRARASKPASPAKALSKQESEPVVKLENRMVRPEPKRLPSEPSMPTALPPTIDYTRPINHIEPLRPAGIKRIHLKVGTREEHDRKLKELAVKAKTDVQAKSARAGASRSKPPSSTTTASTVEQVVQTTDDSNTQPEVPAPSAVEEQAAAVSMTVPSARTHTASPIYLDTSPPTQQDVTQEMNATLAALSQPLDLQPLSLEQFQPSTLTSAPPQPITTSQAARAQRPPPQRNHSSPQITNNDAKTPQSFFSNPPAYTHSQNTLPVFSSTGTIPFAPAAVPGHQQPLLRPNSVTPASSTLHNGHNDNDNNSGTAVSQSMLENLPMASLKHEHELEQHVDVDMDVDMDMDMDMDIEYNGRVIPETPQH